MNEKTINEQYAYIYSLLEDRRLKEALIQLESLLWQCSDWDLRTRLEQLQPRLVGDSPRIRKHFLIQIPSFGIIGSLSHIIEHILI